MLSNKQRNVKHEVEMNELQLLAATGLDTTVWVEGTIMKDGKGHD